MKKLLFLGMFFSATMVFANTDSSSEISNSNSNNSTKNVKNRSSTNSVELKNVSSNEKSSKEKNKMGDCTLTIKGTFDGHKVDVVVTISDVSWGRCVLLKAGIKAAS